MPFGTRGSRCCCGGAVLCSNCDSGTTPSQVSISLSGVADCGACSNCTSMNGTYVLSQTAGNPCEWDYCYDFPSTITRSGVNVNSMQLTFRVDSIFGTIYTQFDIEYWSSTGCTGFQRGGTERFETQTVASSIDCGFSSYGLTLVSSGTEFCTLTSATVSVTEV